MLDAVVLVVLVMALNQEDPPGFLKALAAAIGVAIVGFAAMYGVALISPLLALILVPLILAAAAGFILWVVFDTTPAKSAIGGGIFAVYKLVFAFVWAWLFSTPGA